MSTADKTLLIASASFGSVLQLSPLSPSIALAPGMCQNEAKRNCKGSYLRSKRSDSHTVQAVLEGVKQSMTSSKKREACRSKMEEVRVVPS